LNFVVAVLLQKSYKGLEQQSTVLQALLDECLAKGLHLHLSTD